MQHTTTRVMAVLELLDTHGQISASEIPRLGIGARTVRRSSSRWKTSASQLPPGTDATAATR